MEWLNQVEFWHWIIAALIMLAIEMLFPAAYFLWMGISAFIVALVIYIFPDIPILAQVIIFGCISVFTLIQFKRNQKISTSDEPNLNRRGRQYIGRKFVLEQPIVNGKGKIKVEDSIWRISGIDMDKGTKVCVIDVDGDILKVEKEDEQ